MSLRGKFNDKDGATKALREYVEKESIGHYKDGNKDNIEYLLSMFYEGYGFYDSSFSGNDVSIDSDFDASYSWISRMIDAFETIAPFLEDNFYISIYDDFGETVGVVSERKVQWEYYEDEDED